MNREDFRSACAFRAAVWGGVKSQALPIPKTISDHTFLGWAANSSQEQGVAAINPKFQADTARGAEWNTLNHRNISRFKQFPIQGDLDRLERRDSAKVPNAGQGNPRNPERGFSPLALLCSGDIPELDTELCPFLESGLDYCGNLKWLHKVHMGSVQNQGWDKSKTRQRRELGSCRDFTEVPSLWGTNSS